MILATVAACIVVFITTLSILNVCGGLIRGSSLFVSLSPTSQNSTNKAVLVLFSFSRDFAFLICEKSLSFEEYLKDTRDILLSWLYLEWYQFNNGVYLLVIPYNDMLK